MINFQIFDVKLKLPAYSSYIASFYPYYDMRTHYQCTYNHMSAYTKYWKLGPMVERIYALIQFYTLKSKNKGQTSSNKTQTGS